MSKKFLYFAYASNLLAQRLHINNPSAVRVTTGKLENHRLDFNTFFNKWKGASATIVPTSGIHVWGAIWELDLIHKYTLDEQEGVLDNIYFSKDVNIILEGGDMKRCKVYQQFSYPEYVPRIEDIPHERKPSGIYLRIIKNGAEESGLPEEYKKFLKRIPHNGFHGPINMNLNLKPID